MRKLSRRAASIALAAAMLFTTAGVSQKKVEAASTGKLSVDSNGRITGNKAGTATISAKLKTGTKITISKKIKVVPTNQQIDPWE